MLTDHEASTLANTCERFGVAKPQAVIDAEATEKAARALLDSITAETAPVIAGLTAGNVTKVHEAMVKWESHPYRLAAAQKLTTTAHATCMDAWWASSIILPEQFRKPFEDALQRFKDNLAKLNGTTDAEFAVKTNRSEIHNAMVAAASDVEAMAQLWRQTVMSAGQPNTGSTGRDALTQIIHVDDQEALHKAHAAYNYNTGTWSPEWLAGILTMPGVHIAWPVRGKVQTFADILRPKASAKAVSHA